MKSLGPFLVMVDEHALRELEAEIPWLEVAHLQGPADRFAQSPLQLPAGEVYTHPDTWKARVLPGTVLHASRLKNPFTHRHDKTILSAIGMNSEGRSRPSSG